MPPDKKSGGVTMKKILTALCGFFAFFACLFCFSAPASALSKPQGQAKIENARKTQSLARTEFAKGGNGESAHVELYPGNGTAFAPFDMYMSNLTSSSTLQDVAKNGKLALSESYGQGIALIPYTWYQYQNIPQSQSQMAQWAEQILGAGLYMASTSISYGKGENATTLPVTGG